MTITKTSEAKFWTLISMLFLPQKKSPLLSGLSSSGSYVEQASLPLKKFHYVRSRDPKWSLKLKLPKRILCLHFVVCILWILPKSVQNAFIQARTSIFSKFEVGNNFPWREKRTFFVPGLGFLEGTFRKYVNSDECQQILRIFLLGWSDILKIQYRVSRCDISGFHSSSLLPYLYKKNTFVLHLV